jgi:hypothetical protein
MSIRRASSRRLIPSNRMREMMVSGLLAHSTFAWTIASTAVLAIVFVLRFPAMRQVWGLDAHLSTFKHIGP